MDKEQTTYKVFIKAKKQPVDNSAFTVLDCFCGAGIGAIGSHLAGFNTIFAFDNNSHAVRNYNANISNVAGILDANHLNIDYLPYTDVITGGFPCKPWSVAGSRKGEQCKKNGNLAQVLIDIILTKQPKSFLIENVKGLVSKINFPYFQKMLNQLNIDFNVSWSVINCSHFGIPQKRERVFIIGIRKSLNMVYEFPLPCNSLLSINDAIGDLPQKPDGINNHEYHEKWALRKDEKPFAHKIPEGKNWKSLPPEDQVAFLGNAIKNPEGGKAGYLYVVDRNKPSRTILSNPMGKNSAQLLNFGDGYVRRFTVRENLRLQSVPDWFGFDTETPIKIQFERCSGIPSLVSFKLMNKLKDILNGQ